MYFVVLYVNVMCLFVLALLTVVHVELFVLMLLYFTMLRLRLINTNSYYYSYDQY